MRHTVRCMGNVHPEIPSRGPSALPGGRLVATYRSIPPIARGLIAVRVVRSIGQGMLGVDFVLYLHALGWNAAAIGGLLSASAIVGAALILAVGPLSDRFGRRPFLLVYQILMVFGTALILWIPGPFVLGAVATVLGFGRGANGTAGPFGPAEQAWMAQSVPGRQRGNVFSINNSAAFVGMGIGSLLAGLAAMWFRQDGTLVPYVSAFVLTGGLAVVNLVQLLFIQDTRGQDARDEAAERERRRRISELPETLPDEGMETMTETDANPAAQAIEEARVRPELAPEEERRVAHQENVAMGRLVFVNAINAVGIGMVGPLIPYWFSARFGIGPEAIGPIYALTFFATAVSSLITGSLVTRVGLVRSVVGTRVLGLASLLAMAIAPGYALAAGMYVLRSVMNRGSAGARQALSVGIVRDRRRGLASSLNALSMRLPSALGTAFSGILFSLGSFTLPFVFAAVMQLGYLVLFQRVLGQYEAMAMGEATTEPT